MQVASRVFARLLLAILSANSLETYRSGSQWKTDADDAEGLRTHACFRRAAEGRSANEQIRTGALKIKSYVLAAGFVPASEREVETDL